MVESGSPRQKEMATLCLLHVCAEDSSAYRTMVAREGAIPPLVALSQSSARPKLRAKAEVLIALLRQTTSLRPRSSVGCVHTPVELSH
uniref:Uncharacterized protein n=2 Tax=Oryza brachyantha TaxID=4533 RepID=J3LQ22_ORYBR